MNNHCISAIATATGCGGVAIIRISGEGCAKIANQMFRALNKQSVEEFTPNMMVAGYIQADGFEDFGLCVYFKAPKTFTGEDVVEFHCHGGVQIARGILAKTFALGCSPAGRGEFTKRAFLNGKLSLSSAEGMIDMINAESLAEVKAGGMLYREKLTKQVESIQAEITDFLALLAADIDYPEEDIENDELKNSKERLMAIEKKVAQLVDSYRSGKKIKQGVNVAICGKPNAGKSSLLNELLGYDKAIVSKVAGTTRDAVEGTIELEGVRYNLIDTAGIREEAGEIEAVGIEKAKAIVKTADIILQITDESEEELEIEGDNVIRVFNKADIKVPTKEYDVVLSAKTGKNLDLLKKKIIELGVNGESLEQAYLIEERHYLALKNAQESLQMAIDNVGVFPLDIISIDVKIAWDALGEITGETATEEIINTVFAKFCVGK